MAMNPSFRNPLEQLSLDESFSDDNMFDDIFDVDVDVDDDVEVNVDLDIDIDVDIEPEEVEPLPKKKKKSRRKVAKPEKVHLICGLVDKRKLATPKGAAEAWKQLSEHVDTRNPIPYTPRAQITFDNVIEHTKFGIGIVADMLSAKKAEVVFEDQVRRLACNIGS